VTRSYPPRRRRKSPKARKPGRLQIAPPPTSDADTWQTPPGAPRQHSGTVNRWLVEIPDPPTRWRQEKHRMQPADASAHWWNPERSPRVLTEIMKAAKRCAIRREDTDAAHNHCQGDPCNPGCVVYFPDGSSRAWSPDAANDPQ
jgi:hypothetical protein